MGGTCSNEQLGRALLQVNTFAFVVPCLMIIHNVKKKKNLTFNDMFSGQSSFHFCSEKKAIQIITQSLIPETFHRLSKILIDR